MLEQSHIYCGEKNLKFSVQLLFFLFLWLFLRCRWSVSPNPWWARRLWWTVTTTTETTGRLLQGSNMSSSPRTWPGWSSWRRASGRRQRGRNHRFPRDTWRRAKNTAPSTWTAWRPTYSLLWSLWTMVLHGEGHLDRWEAMISSLRALMMSWRGTRVDTVTVRCFVKTGPESPWHQEDSSMV